MTLSRRAALTGLTLPAAGLWACAPRDQGPVLRVGSQKGGTKSLMLAAGVLDGAPYAIEWSEFGAAQPLLEAIGAGAVDLGAVGDAPFLFAFASGGRVRAVHASRSAGGGASTAILVRGGAPIRTIADLRGKRVATGRGSVGHYVLLARLEAAGLAPGDVTVSFLAPGDAKAAFSSGEIDAWATWGPYVHIAVRDDGARVLSNGRGVLTGLGFQAANVDAIPAKRALLADFLARYSRAQRWSDSHKDAYARVMARETGLDEEIARLTVETGRGHPVPIDATVIAEERRVLERFRSAGAIADAPDIVQGFDTSFNASAV